MNEQRQRLLFICIITGMYLAVVVVTLGLSWLAR